jgi:hypothetical protein
VPASESLLLEVVAGISPKEAVKTYARRVREQRRAHPGITEPGLAAEFKTLLESLLSTMIVPTDLIVVAEYTNKGVGRPDIAQKRAGELARTFVELKAIPFPASRATFDDAAAVGAEIRRLETFERGPAPETMIGLAVYNTPANGVLRTSIEYVDGGFSLGADGSGRIDSVPQDVWTFSVSGYRVLSRWLAARAGSDIDEHFVPQLRDLVGRIRELIDLFQTADSILARTLEEPLSRAGLGLAKVEASEKAPIAETQVPENG